MNPFKGDFGGNQDTLTPDLGVGLTYFNKKSLTAAKTRFLTQKAPKMVNYRLILGFKVS